MKVSERLGAFLEDIYSCNFLSRNMPRGALCFLAYFVELGVLLVLGPFLLLVIMAQCFFSMWEEANK